MSIALPLMMGLALEQLIGMTDVLFLGRYGEAELAAAGVAGIYVMLVMMLGLGYTVGSQSLMSRANGAGRAEEVGAIFRQSASFMTACGFVIMLASWFLIGPMFERFIAADAVRKAADDYVFWRLAGLPFAYVGLLARAYFVAVMHTRLLHIMRKWAEKVSALFFFTYFCRITSRKRIIEKNKDGFKIKMDNRRAA